MLYHKTRLFPPSHRFDIPSSYSGVWRYLDAAYNDESFVRSCPPDAEIVLHWADRPDTPRLLSHEERSALTRYGLVLVWFWFIEGFIMSSLDVHSQSSGSEKGLFSILGY